MQYTFDVDMLSLMKKRYSTSVCDAAVSCFQTAFVASDRSYGDLCALKNWLELSDTWLSKVLQSQLGTLYCMCNAEFNSLCHGISLQLCTTAATLKTKYDETCLQDEENASKKRALDEREHIVSKREKMRRLHEGEDFPSSMLGKAETNRSGCYTKFKALDRKL